MMMHRILVAVFLAIAGLLPAISFGQKLTADDYRKALWMTTRMYGGQRSGDGPNWLIMNHKTGKDFTQDADNGYSLSGGWHDCGDHVKFGQTEFYSAYMLLKAYAEFPCGFDDYYEFNYGGYNKAADFSWEGKKGIPNAIPDILDEVKYATDYFIKCARDANTFYYQVGEGNKDHQQWITSVAMAASGSGQGGQPRTVFKNPNDASMPSFCGATLALMARVYKKFDPTYADLCLKHALFAFAYAKAHPGTVGSPDGDFYKPNAKWEDDFAIMATELYFTTKDSTYKNEAIAKATKVSDHGWSLCYSNNDDLAAYNLAKVGVSSKYSLLKTIVNNYKKNLSPDGVGKTGDPAWGILRYSVSQSYSAALCGTLFLATTVDTFIYHTVDYVLGKNSSNQSFVVGFGAKSPLHPHHRNVYLNDNNVGDKNSLPIPERNRQFGFMVGGTVTPGSYQDNIDSYAFSEGGIDYNCGLVGSLGYIISKLAPVDTNKFTGVITTGLAAHAQKAAVVPRLSGNKRHIKIAIDKFPEMPYCSYRLFTVDGAMVLSGVAMPDPAGTFTVALPGLASGTYFFAVKTAGKVYPLTRIVF
jgi:hypothetical protein